MRAAFLGAWERCGGPRPGASEPGVLSVEDAELPKTTEDRRVKTDGEKGTGPISWGSGCLNVGYRRASSSVWTGNQVGEMVKPKSSSQRWHIRGRPPWETPGVEVKGWKTGEGGSAEPREPLPVVHDGKRN